MCKKDLVQLDFESILKYFRVSLPKRCRNEEVARQLMKLATSLKVFGIIIFLTSSIKTLI